MNHLLLLLLFVMSPSCNDKMAANGQNDPMKNIKTITFYRIRGMVTMKGPIESVFYSMDSVHAYKIKELASENGTRLSADTVKRIKNDDYTDKSMNALIPYPYRDSLERQTYGSPNADDSGGWGMSIQLKNGKEVIMEFDNEEKNIPGDMRDAYKVFRWLEMNLKE